MKILIIKDRFSTEIHLIYKNNKQFVISTNIYQDLLILLLIIISTYLLLKAI